MLVLIALYLTRAPVSVAPTLAIVPTAATAATTNAGTVLTATIGAASRKHEWFARLNVLLNQGGWIYWSLVYVDIRKCCSHHFLDSLDDGPSFEELNRRFEMLKQQK